jgi:hypothetical protein
MSLIRFKKLKDASKVPESTLEVLLKKKVVPAQLCCSFCVCDSREESILKWYQ